MARNVYVKDKVSFLEYYDKIAEYVKWHELENDTTKVRIMIIVPMNEKMVKETILKIKD